MTNGRRMALQCPRYLEPLSRNAYMDLALNARDFWDSAAHALEVNSFQAGLQMRWLHSVQFLWLLWSEAEARARCRNLNHSRSNRSGSGSEQLSNGLQSFRMTTLDSENAI